MPDLIYKDALFFERPAGLSGKTAGWPDQVNDNRLALGYTGCVAPSVLLVVLFLFWLHLSFFLPCVSLCQCFLRGVKKKKQEQVYFFVCVLAKNKKKKKRTKRKESLKENKLFLCAFAQAFLVSALPCSSNIREPQLPQPL